VDFHLHTGPVVRLKPRHSRKSRHPRSGAPLSWRGVGGSIKFWTQHNYILCVCLFVYLNQHSSVHIFLLMIVLSKTFQKFFNKLVCGYLCWGCCVCVVHSTNVLCESMCVCSVCVNQCVLVGVIICVLMLLYSTCVLCVIIWHNVCVDCYWENSGAGR